MGIDKLAARVDQLREPVARDEILPILQRRLLSIPPESSAATAVAMAYQEVITSMRRAYAETTAERQQAEEEGVILRDRIRSAYPFHPALIDIMRELESSIALKKTIARGVAEGTLASLSGATPTLGPDGKFQVNREKVVIGQSLAEDEVDFDSGFLMVPSALPKVSGAAQPGSPSPETGLTEKPGKPEGVPPTTSGTGGDRQRVVRLRFKATRDQVFRAFPAIANLADKSDSGQVTIQVEGIAEEGYDSSWLRNAVEEPLDEADVEKMDF